MSSDSDDESSTDKTNYKFFCDFCDYGTNYEQNYERHLTTNKHATNVEAIINASKFKCTNCDKHFKYQQNMYRHRKECKPLEPSSNFVTGEQFTKAILAVQDKINANNETILKANTENTANILKANNENVKILVDACVAAYRPASAKPESKKSSNFNMNDYLNVKCKKAPTMNEFIKQIEPSYEDMVFIGNYGYIEGNAHVIFRYLDQLDQTERPIQCSDTKRYTIYMKNDNGWEKDDEKLTNTNNIVERLCNRTYRSKKKWTDKHPNYEDMDTKDGKKYLLLIQILTGQDNNLDKMNDAIAKKLAKYCAIKK